MICLDLRCGGMISLEKALLHLAQTDNNPPPTSRDMLGLTHSWSLSTVMTVHLCKTSIMLIILI